jgi:hypothetical protein
MFVRRSTVLAAIALCSSATVAFAQVNVFPNPGFDADQKIVGWTATSDATINFQQPDFAYSDSSGTLALTTNGGSATSPCFAVSAGAPFSFGGQYTATAGGIGSYSESDMSCTSYATSSCSGTGTLLGVSVNLDATKAQLIPIVDMLSPSALSANCTLSAKVTFASMNDDTASVTVDNLYFNSAPPPVTLNGYMSGNWYDPSNPGEGFQLEFTPQQNAVLAIWFTYASDGSGSPIWIYSQGQYDSTSNAVTLPAFFEHGAKFPPAFKSSDVTQTPWGTLTFTFTDCDHGTASWAPTLAGYTAGSMPIARLTSIAGTTCPR